MFTLLVVLITLIAILLILVVLVQSGKGGGLAGIAAGGATQQVLGARQAPDVLERATWIIAAIFVGLCVLTNFAIERDGTTQESATQQNAQQEQTGAPDLSVPLAPPAGGDAAPAPATGGEEGGDQ